VEATTQAYFELRRDAPEFIGNGLLGDEFADGRATDADLVRLGRARAVIDYIASFTDAQALSAAALITGTSDRLWEDGRSL
jgi:dGTPase